MSTVDCYILHFLLIYRNGCIIVGCIVNMITVECIGAVGRVVFVLNHAVVGIFYIIVIDSDCTVIAFGCFGGSELESCVIENRSFCSFSTFFGF